MLLVEDATNTAVDVATSVFDALGAVVKESNDEDSAQSGTTFEAGTPSLPSAPGLPPPAGGPGLPPPPSGPEQPLPAGPTPPGGGPTPPPQPEPMPSPPPALANGSEPLTFRK